MKKGILLILTFICFDLNASYKGPVNIKNSDLRFIYSVISDASVKNKLNCEFGAKLENKPRVFSTGRLQKPVIMFKVKTNSSFSGSDLMEASFSSFSKIEKILTDSPRHGLVERITLYATDDYNHFFDFEHDGTGNITRMEIGTSIILAFVLKENQMISIGLLKK